MAHGVPTFSSGTIPAAGSGVLQALLDKLVERITNYTSNGVQAWTKADVVSETYATYDVTFHSVGDRSLVSGAGDTDLWVRFYNISTTNIGGKVFQDYSPTSHTGHRGQPASQSWLYSITDTGAVDWWTVVNEYGFVLVFAQGTTRRELVVGELVRIFSASVNGRGKITSQSGTGDGVVFGLDRDISNQITVGQRVWLVNQTPDGVSLQTPGVNIATVVAVGSSSITLDGITNTYAVGSLVGMECQPICIFMDLNYDGLMPHKVNGYNYGPVRRYFMTEPVIVASEVAPLVDGSYNVVQPYVVGFNDAGYRTIRGKVELLRGIVKDAAMVEGDEVSIEGSTTKWYVTHKDEWVYYRLLMGPK